MTALEHIATPSPAAGRRYSRSVIDAFAEARGYDAAVLLAIIQVESAGSGFFPDGRLKVLPEPHVLYARTSGKERDAAVRGKVAWKAWDKGFYNGVKSSAQRYAFLERMAYLTNDEDALESCSWGLAQIMGYHYTRCGYPTASAMVLDFWRRGEDAQIEAFLQWLVGAGLHVALRDADWQQIARVYNGSGQVEKYAKMMKFAHARIAQAEPPKKPVHAMLRLGSKGETVANLQRRLMSLGYKLDIDADFGQSTKRAVIAFQVEHGLEADGVVGPATVKALQSAGVAELVERDPTDKEQPVQPVARLISEPVDTVATNTKRNGIMGGALAVVGFATGIIKQVKEIADPLVEALSGLGPLLPFILGFAGAAVAVWAWTAYKSHRDAFQAGRVLR